MCVSHWLQHVLEVRRKLDEQRQQGFYSAMLDEVVQGGLLLEEPSHAARGERIRLLCHFLHRWMDFRVPEVESIAELEGCGRGDLAWGVPFGGELFSPFWYLTMPSEALARAVTRRCLLVKGLVELWGEGSDWDELRNSVMSFPDEKKAPHLGEQQSFKITVDSFGTKIQTEEQVALIEKLDFIPFKGPVQLDEPDVTFRLIVSQAQGGGLPETVPYRLYFGREVGTSDRRVLKKYTLQKRPFLGPTTMDHEMAFVICNQAKVTAGSLVLDPFVGTGSILIAAAHYGAQTIGTDIDFRVLFEDKADSNGCTTNIWTNFSEYDLQPPLGLLRCDAHTLPLRESLEEAVDAIVCDPPYGVRAGGKKSVHKDIVVTDRETHVPSTESYALGECLRDLLDMAARLLVVGGRLVFFMPSTPETYSKDDIPTHPMLQQRYNSEQILTTRYSRRLITLEKVRRYDAREARDHHVALGDPQMAIDKVHDLVYESLKDKDGNAVDHDKPLNIQRFRGKHF